MHVTAPPIVPAPASRFGRHTRRTARRLGTAAAVAAVTLAAIVAVGGPVADALAVVAAANLLLLGTCRLLAATMEDAAEERWLRHALAGLAPAVLDEDEDEDDPGLYVS